MIKKHDWIRTVQWPHEKKDLYVVTILWPKSNCVVYACEDSEGNNINILAVKAYKPTGNYHVDLIQRVKCGCKKALREYIKVNKKYPKFLKQNQDETE